MAGKAIQPAGQGAPAGRIGGRDPLGAPALEGGGGQQPQPVGVGRIGQGIEEALQGRGRRGVEHIRLADQPAGDATALQGLAQLLRLAVMTH